MNYYTPPPDDTAPSYYTHAALCERIMSLCPLVKRTWVDELAAAVAHNLATAGRLPTDEAIVTEVNSFRGRWLMAFFQSDEAAWHLRHTIKPKPKTEKQQKQEAIEAFRARTKTNGF